jgi:1-Cys peroxiredoxin 6
VRAYAGVDDIGFPIIADEARQLAYALGMLDADERTAEGLPLTCRAVFIIGGNDRRVKLSLLYPATTGRNFECVLFGSFFLDFIEFC